MQVQQVSPTLLDAEGSYAHIPAGVEHEILAGPEGARIFYLFVESQPAGTG